MEKTKYSLFIKLSFLVFFSVASCNCSANFATTLVWRVYEQTKSLMRTVHETFGTAGCIVCASAITAITLMSLHKYNHVGVHRRHKRQSVALAVPAGEKRGSMLPSRSSISSAIDKNFHGVRVRVVTGDITTQKVDIIVNAANDHLMGGGGVDGAIQQAAGPELADFCVKNFPVIEAVGTIDIRCPIGEVRVTPPFGLSKQNVKFLIHVNGPRGSTQNREQLLASCYQRALAEANRLKAESIAFPAISVGIFGYPIDEATECAIRTVADAVEKTQQNTIREICFVLYEQDPHYQQLLNAYKTAVAKHMSASK